ncbi:fts3-like protein [Zygosaccharomyces mellis]|uniref:Fts3-like protein n=1 Tax=Zygosaccharomyces mellis TaxID=42258 RepID=A0A4C2E698_9SACH|nr:fts3-like protein [Zygosaccharomyces mellis]
MRLENYFSFQIFFIFLRESLEIIIIISILLAIVKQALSVHDDQDRLNESRNQSEELAPLSLEEEEEVYNFTNGITPEDRERSKSIDSLKLYSKLKIQIVSGGALGLLICMLIGGAFIVVFYHIGADLWGASEHIYEGILSIFASVIISAMGLFFLRIGKLREKFRIKLASIIYSDRSMFLRAHSNKSVNFSEKYAFFILPFITSLREGLEAVVFVGGVGIDQPLSSIPLSMISACSISGVFGFFFFKYSESLSLKICLVVTTCFLYMIAAGLFSKGVWQLELQDYINKCGGQDMSEVGSGPGSYDISRSIWHVNCCNGETDGGWMILTAIFGWTNSATYGSVVSYIIYWLAIIGVIHLLKSEEKGYIPYLPITLQRTRMLKRLKVAKASLDLKSPNTIGVSESGTFPISEQRDSGDSSTPLYDQTSENHGATR